MGDHYALIGDTRTAALVSPWGSIDWLCLPRPDDPPVFGRLLDRGAGRFLMGPAAPATITERDYVPETATLRTTWRVDGARLTLTEGMPAELGGMMTARSMIVRRLECEGRAAAVRINFDPRGGWVRSAGRSEHRAGVLVWTHGSDALGLRVEPAARLVPGQNTVVDVEPGRPLTAVLAADSHTPLVYAGADYAWRLLARDQDWWRAWCREIQAPQPFRSAVIRSLLTLRLLTYSPSGAPIAALTTSLPEFPGGERNWDYRFSWPRDASMGVEAFLSAGRSEEARSYLYWLLHASRLSRPKLPPMLTMFGRPVPSERELTGWAGYDDSRPVRAGNSANRQHQLDVYGWVVDAGWRLSEAGHRLFGEVWRTLASFADFVAERWQYPDAGLWEVRGEPKHYVHSKLMAWLALDRAIRLAGHYPTRRIRVRRWAAARDELAAEIRERGYDRGRNTYLRAYDSDEVDAALLVLPTLGFDDTRPGRIAGTVAAIREQLGAGGPFIYRYPAGHDGLPGGEGAFLPCCFWLVTALAKTGRVDEAQDAMRQLLRLSPMGLFAEEVEPASGQQLGNFPQAFTHAALVQAAVCLGDVG